MAIETVETFRAIRDRHREETREMSFEERAEYMRKKAEAARARLGRRTRTVK